MFIKKFSIRWGSSTPISSNIGDSYLFYPQILKLIYTIIFVTYYLSSYLVGISIQYSFLSLINILTSSGVLNKCLNFSSKDGPTSFLGK